MRRNQYGFDSRITMYGYASIWVIMDWLIKVAHFVPIKTTYFGAMLVSCIWKGLCIYMVSLERLCQTEELCLPRAFGRSYMNQWKQGLLLDLIIIHI
jgi:hypothetical protein